jgi:hypothetical protein
MHTRNAICTLILVAWIAAASWALNALSRSMEFSDFMILGVATIAIMVSCGFAWDYYEARRSRSSLK